MPNERNPPMEKTSNIFPEIPPFAMADSSKGGAPSAFSTFGQPYPNTRSQSREAQAHTQDSTQTMGWFQQKPSEKKDGNEFEDSDNELPMFATPQNGNKGKKNVVINAPDSGEKSNGGDDGGVNYPTFKNYTRDSRSRFSSSRRISTVRYGYVTQDLDLCMRDLQRDDKAVEHIILFHYKYDEKGEPVVDADGDPALVDGDNVIAKVSNETELKASIEEHPGDWFAVISKFIDLRLSYDTDVANATALLEQAADANISALRTKAEVEQNLDRMRNNWDNLRRDLDRRRDEQQTLITKQELSLEKARTLVNRVRGERDDLRSSNANLTQQLADTEANLAAALDNQKQRKPKVREEFDPSSSNDDDDESDFPDSRGRARRSRSPPRGRKKPPRSHSRSRSPPPPKREGRRDTPLSNITRQTPRIDRTDKSTSDPRYPNIRDYHGKDTEDLEQWVAAAETKFNRSWASFPDEWSKVEYLRGYAKEAAYQVIKIRALPQSEDRYEHRQQVYDDLYENFGVLNRRASALGRLAGNEFKQGPKETIGQWVSRFNLIAIEAGLDDQTRIFYALQNLNGRFKAPASHNGAEGESWQQLVNRLRNTEMKLNAAYGNTGDGGDNKEKDRRSKKKDGDNKDSRNRSRNRGDNSYRRNKDQFKIIMEKRVCAKCFSTGHKPNDPDAPCKNSKARPFEELAAMMDGEPDPAELPAQGKE
jgi:hypothetical protein